VLTERLYISGIGFIMPKSFKLVPYKVIVHRKYRPPYIRTQWKKAFIFEPASKSGIQIIHVDLYQGNLETLYSIWDNFIKHLGYEDEKLSIPLLALKEIIQDKYDGILAIFSNNIVGIASIKISKDDEARVSIISASPKMILDKKDTVIEDGLREGINEYIKSKHYLLIDAEIYKDVEDKSTYIHKQYNSSMLSNNRNEDRLKCSYCGLVCNCLFNFGCRCLHDCICPDIKLIENIKQDYLIIPVRIINTAS